MKKILSQTPRIILMVFNFMIGVYLICRVYFGFFGVLEFSSKIVEVMTFGYFSLCIIIGTRSLFFCRQILCSVLCLLVSAIFIKFLPPFFQTFALINIFLSFWIMKATPKTQEAFDEEAFNKE